MEVHSWEYHRVITRLTLTSSMGRIAQDVIVKLLSDHRAAMSKLTANEIQFVRSQLEVHRMSPVNALRHALHSGIGCP